jgi:galactose-1-phosphate uridylyltransferase
LIGTTNGIVRQLADVAFAWLNPVMDQNRCPFCDLEKSRICLENDFAATFPDAFPVVEGHTLVVPKQHVASLFELTEEELAAVWKLVALVRGKLMAELKPDGFNIGVNDGSLPGHGGPKPNGLSLWKRGFGTSSA